MSVVANTVLKYLPFKQKTSPNGWRIFDAPCCVHNGETQDTKQRGGLISNPDGGISYNCFNCGFKASWQPGRNLSYKMRKLLRWLNTPDDTINKLALEVMRENEGIEIEKNSRGVAVLPQFNTVSLPDDALLIQDDHCATSNHLDRVKQYLYKRKMLVNDGYEYYWSPSLAYRDRVIIPFKYENRIVGWTARSVLSDANPRYLMESQPGFVYNLDEQRHNKIFCILTEGPIDANYIDAASIMGSEVSDQQAMLLDRLNKEIIVVPDRDSKGKSLVEQAINRGWSVSMPDWNDECNDVGDAVLKHGRIYTLYSIATQAQSSPLKIRLRAKKWFT
jgi:hypothetical protein